MNGITSRCISFAQGNIDPWQRVNYSFGLVLGVDEFVQEQIYFLEKEYQHNRALHGYGTVSGLLVGVAENGDDIEVQVERGIGIDQYGRVFVVRSTQCASLLSWLADQELAGDQTIYVVARYAECDAALVPIAGQPCSTSDQLTAPSRLQDVFEIELVLEPPDHAARDAVVNLSEFLSRFRADPSAAGLGDLGEANRLGAIIGPDFITQTPDAFRTHINTEVEQITGNPGDRLIPIQPSAAEALLDDIFTYWITIVRPSLDPDLIDPDAPESAEADPPPAEILLAQIELTIPEDDLVVLDGIAIDNSTRPYLMHTQLIQELFDIPDMAGEGGVAPTAQEIREWVSIRDISARRLAFWFHIDEDLDLVANENIILERIRPNGNIQQVTIELEEEVPRRNEAGRYYQVRTFTNLNNGDFLLLRSNTDQIQVAGDTLTNFITNAFFTYPNYLPGQGQLLAFHIVDRIGGVTETRVRQLIQELASAQQPIIPFVTITPITRNNEAVEGYELWFHLNGFAEKNDGRVGELHQENTAMFVETAGSDTQLVPIDLEPIRENVWMALPRRGNLEGAALVRFAFSLDVPIGIEAFNPQASGIDAFDTLREYIEKTGQRLKGHQMISEQLNGEALVVYVREQVSARRLRG